MTRRLFTTAFRNYTSPAYLLALGLLCFAPASPAATVGLDFVCISHNSVASCAAGEQQLRVTLEQTAASIVTFTFTNVGHRASVIGQLYFEDPKGLLQGISSLSAGSHGHVDFAPGARPSNLPGGRAPAAGFQAHFSLGAGKPAPRNGINNGTGSDLESLAVNFLSGYDFASLRSALASGELRLGVHVQGFDGGFSESYISAAPAAVPVPETVWLFASGLFGFVGIARRRREQPATARTCNAATA